MWEGQEVRPRRLEEREEKKGKAERKLKECQIDRALVLALALALHCWFKGSFGTRVRSFLSSHVEVKVWRMADVGNSSAQLGRDRCRQREDKQGKTGISTKEKW